MATTQRGVSTPSNAYFDTYQKMNWLMNTLQNTHDVKAMNKPSLKAMGTGRINIAKLDATTKGDHFNDSIYAGVTPKVKERAVHQNDGDLAEDKRVNFSLENMGTKPSNENKKNSQRIPLKQGSNVPRNFKQLAK